MRTLEPARRLRGALLPLAASSLLAGCAGVHDPARPLVDVSEIPPAGYQVRSVVALGPTKQADAEMVAAILYLLPSSIPVAVWEGSYPTGGRGWLVSQPLGQGNGTEHLRLVKSATHYDAVMLALGDGRRIGYALVHKAVRASIHEARGEAVVFLNAQNFIDPGYIDSGGR